MPLENHPAIAPNGVQISASTTMSKPVHDVFDVLRTRLDIQEAGRQPIKDAFNHNASVYLQELRSSLVVAAGHLLSSQHSIESKQIADTLIAMISVIGDAQKETDAARKTPPDIILAGKLRDKIREADASSTRPNTLLAAGLRHVQDMMFMNPS